MKNLFLTLSFVLLFLGCSKTITVDTTHKKALEIYVSNDFVLMFKQYQPPAKSTIYGSEKTPFEKNFYQTLRGAGYGVKSGMLTSSIHIYFDTVASNVYRLTYVTSNRSYSRVYTSGGNGVVRSVSPWTIKEVK